MTPQTERLSAALADRYRIERELGTGGMATVYLAEDIKHDRKVAIKVLKPELAAVLGAERFVQEIKTTAALSHPHILPLFDSGEAAGFLYYVMPYIQGETIREKLNRETQFGIEEAVRITTEVADALDYAHRHGVIHRDIKPENILLHDGRPMVMDFGIALAVSAAAGGRMTETGLSLGTPHYMSPEQATADKDITARSDVYSLATVLYEMLAGEPPHMGNSAQQIIMKILTDTPRPVSDLRRSVPGNVAAALGKALEKLPADRFDSAKAFAQALGDSHFTEVHQAGRAAPDASGMSRHAPWVVAGALALTLVAVLLLRRPAPAIRESPRTFVLQSLGDSVEPRDVGISRDGREIVIRASVRGEQRFFHRSIDAVGMREIPGTNGADGSFVIRPDRTLIFWRDRDLFEVRVDAGSPRRFAKVGADPAGMSWDDEAGLVLGMLTFSSPAGLSSVARGDTAVTVVTQTAIGVMHHDPVILGDGSHAVYTDIGGGNRRIGVTALADGSQQQWDIGGTLQQVVGVSQGVLLYIAGGGAGLMAISWDERGRRPVGEPVAVPNLPERVNRAAVADDGTLVVLAAPRREYYVQLVDSTGRLLDSYLNQRVAQFIPRFNSDASQVAFRSTLETINDVRVLRLEDRLLQPLRMGGGGGLSAVAWTANNSILAGMSDPNNTPGGFRGRRIVTRPADASDTAKLVFQDSSARVVSFDVSRDGQLLAIESIPLTAGSASASDITVLRADSPDQVLLRVASNADEVAPRLSPDGRWLAYSSNESGRYEVYVRSVTGSATAPISAQGGGTPVWSPDAGKLYYRTASQLMVARIELSASGGVRVGRRDTVLTAELIGDESASVATYDVDSRGRIILARALGGESAPVIVRTGWISEVKALLTATNR